MLITRLATQGSNRQFLLKTFDLWEEVYANLQTIPGNFTGLSDATVDAIPPIEVVKLWERELRERIVLLKSALHFRGLMLSVPALVAAGIEQEAAQRICTFT